jgi:hypothetical protein
VLAGFAEKHGISYELLSDEGSRVIRALGLFNERVHEQHAVYGIAKNDRAWGVPYPGVFLLDEQGRVVEKRFQQSYRERETGAGLLEQGFHAASSLHGARAESASDGVAVRAWLDSETYRFFQRLWLTVELQVAPGLHVYGRPVPEGYIPLSIEVAPIEGVTVGEPEWPEPHPFRVEGLDEQFMVYAGSVSVSLPVTLALRDAGDQTLHVSVRYQACSANDCLLPSSVSLDLPVKAADLVT